MKATGNLFRTLSIWLALAVAGFDVHAAKEPLYEGLGSYSRNITTDSPEAQRYFDQGLAFVHGFNHNAAIRAFQQAAELEAPQSRLADHVKPRFVWMLDYSISVVVVGLATAVSVPLRSRLEFTNFAMVYLMGVAA